jgi:hypothetical protein
VGIAAGKGHLGLEISPIVQRVWVQDNECYTPLEDVVVHQLEVGQLLLHSGRHSTSDTKDMRKPASIWVHVSLLRALNSFMSLRCAASAILSSLSASE